METDKTIYIEELKAEIKKLKNDLTNPNININEKKAIPFKIEKIYEELKRVEDTKSYRSR